MFAESMTNVFIHFVIFIPFCCNSQTVLHGSSNVRCRTEHLPLIVPPYVLILFVSVVPDSRMILAYYSVCGINSAA